MVTANSVEVGKVGNDCGLLTAESQVDEILQLEKLQLVGHRLKLCGLAGVEAVQPFCEVVQLLYIDRAHLRALKDSIEAVDLLHLAVRLDRVADLQRLQQLHAVCVLVAGDGEWDGRHAVFRVVGITENRLNHHVISSNPLILFIRVRRQVSSLCQQMKPCLDRDSLCNAQKVCNHESPAGRGESLGQGLGHTNAPMSFSGWSAAFHFLHNKNWPESYC